MSDQRLKIAVFIDFDNVEIGVKTTLGLQFDVGAVLEAIKERGEIITKVAYGDWKRAGDHGRAMSQHAVRLVQRVMTPGGDKNGADINLALDALELAFTHHHINAFVIVGGDSDFITLVEKLKQYDKKVFVVGGRAFTGQVMQKNCTEFIAYENVAGRGAPRAERGRAAGPAQSQAQSLDHALPLVKRALKVLSDREVSPQLGLLKSTLLQLDSSFSERDYGASTFRDFAEKLQQRGLVSLKHSGRTTVVELADGVSDSDTGTYSDEAPAAVVPAAAASGGDLVQAPRAAEPPADEYVPASELTLADGVALVRAVLSEAATQPRWPMYLRQMKQFLRTARPDFDERRYGSLHDLLRACQKDGLVRLERDRQGGLRAFAGSSRPANVPHGWGGVVGAEPVRENGSGAEDSASEEADAAPVLEVIPQEGTLQSDVAANGQAEPAAPQDVAAPRPGTDEPEDDQLAMFGVVSHSDPEPKAKRARKTRPAGEPASASGSKAKRGRKAPATATRTRSRRTPS
jgi:uncharacterized LabA/DUF88 family protein